jgi:cold shock CspA family protein
VPSTAVASHNSIPAQRENLRPVSSDLARDHSRHVGNRTPSPARQIGTVKFYDRKRRLGFIIPSKGGPEIFVHEDDLRNTGWLSWNQQVEFERVEMPPPLKPRARNVVVIGGRK